MNSKNGEHSRQPEQTAKAPPPKKRFRIEKLAERVAPKKGGFGTNNTCSSLSAGGGY
jgi:hypothetical protein